MLELSSKEGVDINLKYIRTASIILLVVALLTLAPLIELIQAQGVPVSLLRIKFYYNPGPVGQYVEMYVIIINKASTEKVVSVKVESEKGLTIVPNETRTVTVPPREWWESYGLRQLKFLVKGEFCKTYVVKVILFFEGKVIDELVGYITFAKEVRIVFELFDEFDNSPVLNAKVYVWPRGYSYADSQIAIRTENNRYEITVPQGVYHYLITVVHSFGSTKLEGIIEATDDKVISLKLDAGKRAEYFITIFLVVFFLIICISVIYFLIIKSGSKLSTLASINKIKKVRRTKTKILSQLYR